MKFKTTLALFAIFIVLLAFVIFFEFKSSSEEDSEEKLVSLSSENIEKIVFKKDSETIQFQKEGEDWIITRPLQAKADQYEVNRLADEFSDLTMEKRVEEEPEDLKKYGIPQKEVNLFVQGQEEPVKILVGMENPLDNTFFAKREGETQVVLIPSTLKSILENNVFDFRMKDIFTFETDQAKNIRLRANNIRWEAEKKEDEWFLRNPVNALAKKSSLNDVLYALSNLKAKEFISEDKKKEDIEEFGLHSPNYEVTVHLPLDNQQVTFFLHKKDEKVYATSSLSSKIIRVEDSILSSLEKEADELREKKVCDFFTWEVQKLHIRYENVDLKLSKDEEDNWRFESAPKQPAEKDKIQSFLRKIESLEAEEFVDPPLNLEDYGLDTPRGEVNIGVKADEDKTKDIKLFIGVENKEAEKVFVKNARFEYVFKVSSAFQEEFPGKAEDWISQE